MNQIQRATNIVEGRILNSLETQEELSKNKQTFISNFIKSNRELICNDMETIATILINTEDEDQYLRLFDCIAELAYSGTSKQLQVAVDEIIDSYLTKQVELLWSEMNDNQKRRYASNAIRSCDGAVKW